MTALTPLPTPPSRNDPANFGARADVFLAALPVFAAELNRLLALVPAESASGLALALSDTSPSAGSSLVDFTGRGLTVGGTMSAPRMTLTAANDSGTPDAALRVVRTLSALGINGGHDVRAESTITGGAAGTGHAAFDAANTLSAAGFDHLVSFQSRPAISGNPTHVYGLTHRPTFDAGAHAINNYALYMASPDGDGTVENNYGVYIPMQTKGSVSNHPIYVAQQGAPSFFGSPLQVNNLLMVDPAAPYIVGGATVIDYPYAGYNYNPITATYQASDFVVTTRFDDKGFRIFTAAPGAAGSACTLVERLRMSTAGDLIYNVSSTPVALAANGQMVATLLSNTLLRLSVRGSDGVTRKVDLTLSP